MARAPMRHVQEPLFTGMHSLSDVLEQTRVIRAARAASLAEPEPEPEPAPEPEYVYGIRDGEVVEFAIIKRTPKFVKFATGNPRPSWFRDTFTDHLECYVEREAFERDGKVGVWWGPFYRHPAGVHAVYATREAAEAAAGGTA